MAALYKVIDTTIPNGDTDSDVVDLENRVVTGLILPTLTTGDLTFKVAANPGDTPVLLKSKAAANVAVTAGTGGWAVSADDLTPLAAYRWVQIISAASQGGARTLKWITKG